MKLPGAGRRGRLSDAFLVFGLVVGLRAGRGYCVAKGKGCGQGPGLSRLSGGLEQGLEQVGHIVPASGVQTQTTGYLYRPDGNRFPAVPALGN